MATVSEKLPSSNNSDHEEEKKEDSPGFFATYRVRAVCTDESH
jgi:hypothetical protein